MEHLERGLGQKVGTHGLLRPVIRTKMSAGKEWKDAGGEVKAPVI